MKKIAMEIQQISDFNTKEAYKTLRTNIRFCGDSMKVIVFTSAVPGEGKSSVSFQLAKAFSEDEKKVLFIDADIRKSVLQSRFKLESEVVGLTHYLSGLNTKQEVIYSTPISNLDIIFSGHVVPNPVELLGNHYFAELIQWGREEYEYVIVDSPPLGSVIDTAVIAKECDGAVLVIESDHVGYRLIQKVKQQLEASGCKIIGAVLNKVDLSVKKYYEKGYGEEY